MEYEELKSRIENLKDIFDTRVRSLEYDFAMANNPHSVGDIIKDHIGIIKIERITHGKVFSSDILCAIYYGSELRNDLQPKKNGAKRIVWQTNLIKK